MVALVNDGLSHGKTLDVHGLRSTLKTE